MNCHYLNIKLTNLPVDVRSHTHVQATL